MSTVVMPGTQAKELLEAISEWGNVTTIILHGGCVFEFKGPFPVGTEAEGYYNLKGAGEGAAAGFEGHLNLSKVKEITFQEKQHRRRDSYALVFVDENEQAIFKIFLGREADGSVIEAQLDAFNSLKSQRSC